ncbi:TIGR00282 family metallophosphoesterase [Mucisphaera sp.]|uniref:TIGR00282 family metallophosphoesterase n=1 Tax=Mucisphaera sp. TaxID=2913024 RepID=UPI003D133767
MSIRIALLGDVVGTVGRQAVTQAVGVLRGEMGVSLVIANAENAANGSGLTPELHGKLIKAGVDGMTLGDHAYRKKQIVSVLEREGTLIRPANLSAKAKGKVCMRLVAEGEGGVSLPVYVFTVVGRLFMNTMQGTDPFGVADGLLSQIHERPAAIFVEVHAEATSEKVAMGWYLNERVTAVFGTHTHIQTADARVLPGDVAGPRSSATVLGLGPGGTGYITDLGMSGPQDSVLGRRVDRVVSQMTTGMPAAFDVAEGNPEVRGVIVEVDPKTGRSVGIEPLVIKADLSKPPFSA